MTAADILRERARELEKDHDADCQPDPLAAEWRAVAKLMEAARHAVDDDVRFAGACNMSGGQTVTLRGPYAALARTLAALERLIEGERDAERDEVTR